MFVSEIKRFARASGLNGTALADLMGCDQATLNKHFATRKRRPHLETVRRYAKVLGVNETYLRIISGHWQDDDAPAAVAATYAAAEGLAGRLTGVTIDKVWTRLQRAAGGSSVLIALYGDALRRDTERSRGLAPLDARDRIGVFVDALADIGIDVRANLRVPDSLAYDVALFLSGSVGLLHEDVCAILESIEGRLRARNIDVRTFQLQRREIKKYRFTKYMAAELVAAEKLLSKEKR